MTNFVRTMTYNDVAFAFFIAVMVGGGFMLFSLIMDITRVAKNAIAIICVAAMVITGAMYHIAKANYSVEYSTEERLAETTSLIAAGEVEKDGGKVHGNMWYIYGEYGSESYYKFYHMGEDGGIHLEQFPAKDVTIYYGEPRFETWQAYDITTKTWFGETSRSEWKTRNGISYRLYVPEGTIEGSYSF